MPTPMPDVCVRTPPGTGPSGVSLVHALAVEAPAVERTLQALVDDGSADPEMGAEMRAVGVDDVRLPADGPVDDEVLAEGAHGANVSRRHVVRPAQLEPTGRPHRQR